jgi:tetratricopeptide (TPR) repeat protein
LAALGDEQWDEAIVALQHFLEMDEAEDYAPDDPDTIHGRAGTYACAARIPEAITSFERFARRWPEQARQRQSAMPSTLQQR